MKQYIDYSKEVQEAIKNHRPIVALESTIISHGMPYPENFETAKHCEQILRDQGVTPATICIIKGRIKIGCEEEDLAYLAKQGTKVIKTSRRDIPYIISTHKDGATTVSATMICASLAGIRIFATGGVGGVHRGAEQTFDISADLDEFAQTDVCVISAGCKSILDLPKTMEYLETKGVSVLGYQTEYLPEFYTNGTDLKVNYRVDTPKEISDLLHVKWDLGLQGGVLVTNPIPSIYQMNKTEIDQVIQKAICSSQQEHIEGKETTPYLLAKIKEITNGESLKANIHLVYHNVELAGEIAKEYYKSE